MTAVVIWKDGTYKYVKQGETYEYENDPNWLLTIPAPSQPSLTDKPVVDKAGEDQANWDMLEKKVSIWLEEQSKHMKIGERYTYPDVVGLIMNYCESNMLLAAPSPSPVSDAVNYTLYSNHNHKQGK